MGYRHFYMLSTVLVTSGKQWLHQWLQYVQLLGKRIVVLFYLYYVYNILYAGMNMMLYDVIYDVIWCYIYTYTLRIWSKRYTYIYIYIYIYIHVTIRFLTQQSFLFFCQFRHSASISQSSEAIQLQKQLSAKLQVQIGWRHERANTSSSYDKGWR